jgi:hypothetical protein
MARGEIFGRSNQPRPTDGASVVLMSKTRKTGTGNMLTKTFLGLGTGLLLLGAAGAASAAERTRPLQLSAAQMDGVTAGRGYSRRAAGPQIIVINITIVCSFNASCGNGGDGTGVGIGGDGIGIGGNGGAVVVANGGTSSPFTRGYSRRGGRRG